MLEGREVSMGGGGTWSSILSAPDKFAALAPVAGGARGGDCRSIAHVPVWVFQGAVDNIVPVQFADHAVEEPRKAGGTVKYTKYDSLGTA